MKSKREVLESYAETGSCPLDLNCIFCPYEKMCDKLEDTLRKIGARKILKIFPKKRKFDKSKILTSITAEQAKVGMRGYFGDSLAFLRTKFENREQIFELVEILDEKCMCRFKQSDGLVYSLFYPIDEVEE